MMENGIVCFENDSVVFKLIFKKKKIWIIFMIENKGIMRINGYWILFNLFCVWYSGNMISYGNNLELLWNFFKVFFILKLRVVNYIM